MSTSDGPGPDEKSTDEKPTDEKPGVDQLEADLEEQRRQLGETVDALTDKMDVKGRTKERVSDTVAQARHQALDARARAVDLATDDHGSPTPQAYSVAAATAVALVVAGVLWWRRRNG